MPYEIDQRPIIDTNNPNKITIGANNDFPDYESEIILVEESFKILRNFINDLRAKMDLT